MAIPNIKSVLDKLALPNTGRYDNHFYIIDLQDSDEYAKMYTILNTNAINTEYPNFGINTNNTTIKITNYFELDYNNQVYNIFLIADFENDKYLIKIGEK